MYWNNCVVSVRPTTWLKILLPIMVLIVALVNYWIYLILFETNIITFDAENKWLSSYVYAIIICELIQKITYY